MFEDWGVDKYMHSIQDGYNLQLGSQYPFVFANMIKDDVHSDQMSNKGFWENKINNWYIENNQVPVAQFHFDTFKLNEYLTSHAGARGINIIDDEITKVNHDDEGNISTIESDTATYDYDFYIDRFLKNISGSLSTFSFENFINDDIVGMEIINTVINCKDRERAFWESDLKFIGKSNIRSNKENVEINYLANFLGIEMSESFYLQNKNLFSPLVKYRLDLNGLAKEDLIKKFKLRFPQISQRLE